MEKQRISKIDSQMVDIRLALTNTPPSDGRPLMVKCRAVGHMDNKPTLGIFPSNINCFNPACRFHISRRYEALAYLLDMWDGVDVHTAYEGAMRAREVAHNYLTTQASLVPVESENLDPISMAVAQGYMANLYERRPHRVREYLVGERGFNEWAITNGMLGHDSSRFTIPVIDKDGWLRTFRFRNDDYYAMGGDDRPYAKYTGVRGRNNQPLLYPEHLLTHHSNRSYVWLVEGELDALRILQEGEPAVSMINGAGQTHKAIPLLQERFPHIKIVVICTDMDSAGRAAMVETVRECVARGMRYVIATWDKEQGKDITEFLQRGNSMKEIQVYEHTTDRMGRVEGTA